MVKTTPTEARPQTQYSREHITHLADRGAHFVLCHGDKAPRIKPSWKITRPTAEEALAWVGKKTERGWNLLGFEPASLGLILLDMDDLEDAGQISAADEYARTAASWHITNGKHRGKHLLFKEPPNFTRNKVEQRGKKKSVSLLYKNCYAVLWNIKATCRALDSKDQHPCPLEALLDDPRLALNDPRDEVKLEIVPNDLGFDNTEAEILSALKALSPDMAYADWLAIGHALHDWNAESGLTIWDDWSKTGTTYKEGEPAAKWPGFTAGGGVTIATLFHQAKTAGWDNPLAGEPCNDLPPYYENAPQEIQEIGKALHSEGVEVAHNQLTLDTVIRERDGSWTPPDDKLIHHLYYLCPVRPPAAKKPICFDDWRRRLSAVSERNQIHPVKEYFAGLPEWDGKPRLESWLTEAGFTFGEEQDGALAKWASAAPFRALVWRTHRPGWKIDQIPVFYGPANIGKSAAVKHLLPEEMSDYWTDGLDLAADDKAKAETIMGKAMIELAELSPPKRLLEHAKRGLTSSGLHIRQAYHREAVRVHYQCGIVGTTNSAQCLADDVAYRRRFVVLHLAASERPVEDHLKECREQLWAEALVEYHAGVLPGLSRELSQMQTEANEGYVDADIVMLDAIRLWENEGVVLRQPTLIEIAEEVSGKMGDRDLTGSQQFTRRLAAGLRNEGYSRKRARRNGNLCYIWEKE